MKISFHAPFSTYEKLFFQYPLLLVKTCFSPTCTPSWLTNRNLSLPLPYWKHYALYLFIPYWCKLVFYLPLLYWWKLVLHLPHPYLRLLPCSIVSLSQWCREQLQTVLAASPQNQAQDPVKRTNKLQLKETALIHLSVEFLNEGYSVKIFKCRIFLHSPLHLFVAWFEIWHYPHVERRHYHPPPETSCTPSPSPCHVNQQGKW